MTTQETVLPEGVEPIGDVHLLLSKGHHYDLLYPATDEDRLRGKVEGEDVRERRQGFHKTSHSPGHSEQHDKVEYDLGDLDAWRDLTRAHYIQIGEAVEIEPGLRLFSGADTDDDGEDGAISCNRESKVCIVVKRCVRDRLPLTSIAGKDRFDYSLGDKIATLSNSYPGYLEIAGDGNCYYRAIIFGLIEQIISDPSKRKLLLRIRDLFGKLLFDGLEFEQHAALLEALEDAAGEPFLHS